MRIINNMCVDEVDEVLADVNEKVDVNPDDAKTEIQVYTPMELVLQRLDKMTERLDALIGWGPQQEIVELKCKLEIAEGLVKDKHNVIATLMCGGLKATQRANRLEQELNAIKEGSEIESMGAILRRGTQQMREGWEDPEVNKPADGTIINSSSFKRASHTKRCNCCGKDKHYRAFKKYDDWCRECHKVNGKSYDTFQKEAREKEGAPTDPLPIKEEANE